MHPSAPPRRTHRTARTAGALAALLTLTACGTAASDDGSLEVLASFYPLQFVTEQVGGDRVTVTNLTPLGGEPHDLELSPAAIGHLNRADLVVVQSGFQPAVDQAVLEGHPARTLDATAVLEAAPAAEPALPPHDDDHVDAHDEHEHEHEHEHDEQAHDEHDHDHDAGLDAGHAADDGHDHGGVDPHFWLDPTRLALLAPAVAESLAAADPAGADEYRSRADTLVDELTSLDAAFTAGLASCTHRTLVTSHAAFGHLGQRYDLDQVSVAGLDPDTEPSPRRIREVADVVREAGVPTIFFESAATAKVAEVLAEDAGVTTAALSPLESLTREQAAAGDDYLTIMTANLAALRTGLDCA
ncbi:zinc ABC transporter substrate-binding protein [Flavimobilis sp. GY10621]|uniref:Zinc ABC transporter substrate-binding protein n=1 Tax=Flavimobilis rhizosphaerae TaxID=2775421 RepID=A0ABR9DSP4_9MICO|nr:zinc ABC transporter substrate-binding protein [Flavimobilis rhizosphaerae]MBD9700142.1 zinc ABC transporter substrate-binding protein [Flavimobilis rhizosphaerae]